MSRESSLKEEIGWLKVLFGLLIAAVASLVAWVAQNFVIANPFILGVAVFAILLLGISIWQINAMAYRRIRKLEDT